VTPASIPGRVTPANPQFAALRPGRLIPSFEPLADLKNSQLFRGKNPEID